MLEKEIKYMI